MRPFTALLLSLVCTAAVAGEVYRWVDKDGNVHYGDRPKHAAQPVEVRTPDTGEPDENAKVASARAAECDRLKSQYDTYMKATTIKETDNLGRTKDYTPEERQQFLQNLARQRDAACAPPETP